MSITATSITPENTLEEFRIQFNKLVVDVDGVGVTLLPNQLSLREKLADESETTLLATDPTADRTITLPDATGTVVTTGNSDAGATTTNSGEVSHVLVDVGGTLKKITPPILVLLVQLLLMILVLVMQQLISQQPLVILRLMRPQITQILFSKELVLTSDITINTLDGSEAGNAAFNALSTVGTTLSLIDDQKIILGGDSDISLRYDEAYHRLFYSFSRCE